ncbi:MAG: zf-HC2 domain-containing protein [Planctomycetota bacterium]
MEERLSHGASCLDAQEWIRRQWDDELDPGLEAALEQHLSGCNACRRYRSSQREVQGLLADWAAEPVSRSAETSDRARRIPWTAYLEMAAAAALIGLTVYFVWSSAPAEPGSDPVSERGRTAEIEPRVPPVEVEGKDLLVVNHESETPGVHVVWIYDVGEDVALENGDR